MIAGLPAAGLAAGLHPRNEARERGSAAIWVIAASSLVLAAAYFGVARTTAVLARHRVEAAADLAALAAASRIGVAEDSCAQAGRIASANDATLRSCSLRLRDDARSGSVRVVVTASATLPLVGSRSLTASADAARLPAGGSGAWRRPAA